MIMRCVQGQADCLGECNHAAQVFRAELVALMSLTMRPQVFRIGRVALVNMMMRP